MGRNKKGYTDCYQLMSPSDEVIEVNTKETHAECDTLGINLPQNQPQNS